MTVKKSDLAIGILVMIIWGANFSVIGVGLGSLDPFLMTFLRAILCAFPLVFFIKKPKNISVSTLAIYGIIFGVGMGGGMNLAMTNGLSAGMTSVLLQFSAFFTIIFGYLFLKENITKTHVVGMMFSSAGLLIIVFASNDHSTHFGILFILLAALCWAVCNLIVKIKKPEDMITFIVWSSLFSAPVLLIVTLLAEGTEPLAHMYSTLTWQGAFSVLFQSYVTTIFGYMTWNNLLKKYPTHTIAPLSLIVPVAGIFTSYLFFHEQLSVIQGLAILCIFIGISIFINSATINKRVSKRQAQCLNTL